VPATTAWTAALDAFEADLDRVAAALDGGAWPNATWSFRAPAELGAATADERARHADLALRAQDLVAEVGEAMARVAEELVAGPRRRIAARDYARTGALTAPADATER
jgi:hypothetical protein